MALLRALLGLVVLLFGRQLFWLWVGVTGFLAGVTLSARFLSGQPNWIILLIGLIAGLVGALLAIVLQRLAIGIAGFVAGGYILVALLNLVGVTPGRLAWLPYVIGGILGAVLVLFLFDWALIVLSSLTGATLVVQALALRPSVSALAFIILVVVGIVVQAALMRREPPQTTSRSQV